ncbi:MAG TPA: type II toxin-antitoxin system HigB family toxin [Drouetiella sp.]
MEIRNESDLHSFARKHADSRKSISIWLEVVKSASWLSFADVRHTFRSADYVKDLLVFDVGGNKYRIVCLIDYPAQRLYVIEVFTHAQYDRWKV